jgi:hypothetical protein
MPKLMSPPRRPQNTNRWPHSLPADLGWIAPPLCPDLISDRDSLSQSQLANRLGVTFQQVRKYEIGANRIGTGRLHDVCSNVGNWRISRLVMLKLSFVDPDPNRSFARQSGALAMPGMRSGVG